MFTTSNLLLAKDSAVASMAGSMNTNRISGKWDRNGKREEISVVCDGRQIATVKLTQDEMATLLMRSARAGQEPGAYMSRRLKILIHRDYRALLARRATKGAA